MKHIITAVIAVICIMAGGFAGHFLKTSGSEAPAEAHAGEVKSDGAEKAPKETASKEAPSKEASSKGGGEASGEVVFYKFSREFIVPILEEERVESLVILNINLEADAELSQELFRLEPKLRDNIMTTLIELSNDGRTFQTITDVQSYEAVRSMILMNLKNVVSEGIHNVLILDMAKQNL